MAQIFNQNSFNEDLFSSTNFLKGNFSPRAGDFEAEDDLIEPFNLNNDDKRSNPFGVT